MSNSFMNQQQPQSKLFQFGADVKPYGSSQSLANSSTPFSQLSFGGQTNAFSKGSLFESVITTNSVVNKPVEIKNDSNSQIEAEIKNFKNPQIYDIERRQKEILEARKNKTIREDILSENDIQTVLKNPILKRINEKINKICQQTDQFLILIDNKEENYLFPISMDSIKADINKIKDGTIKYGNNTDKFQKNLSELGYLCWQSSSQLEQVEIEIKRMEKCIISKESNEGITSNSKRSEENQKKKLKELNDKMNLLKKIFEEFDNYLTNLQEEQKSSDKFKLNELRQNLNLFQQDAKTQCFEGSTLSIKLQNNSNTIGKKPMQKEEDKLILLKQTIQERLNNLNQLLIEQDVYQLDLNEYQKRMNNKNSRQLKNVIDLNLDDIDDSDQFEEPKLTSTDDHNLTHYQHIMNIQNNKNSTNKKSSQLPQKSLNNKKKEENNGKNQKVIDLDLDDISSDSSDCVNEEEENNYQVNNVIDLSLTNSSYRAQNVFLQCQSSILGISIGGRDNNKQNVLLNKQSNISLKEGSILQDPILHKIQTNYAQVNEPHNIKYRQNMFDTLKNSFKNNAKSSIEKNKNIIPQSTLTPLQYESLAATIVKEKPKSAMNETPTSTGISKQPLTAKQTTNGYSNEGTKTSNIGNHSSLPQKNNQTPSNPIVAQPTTGIKIGQQAQPLQPIATKNEPQKTELKKVKSQYSIDENEEINNPLDSDESEESEESEEVDAFNRQSVVIPPPQLSLGAKGSQSLFSLLGKDQPAKKVESTVKQQEKPQQAQDNKQAQPLIANNNKAFPITGGGLFSQSAQGTSSNGGSLFGSVINPQQNSASQSLPSKQQQQPLLPKVEAKPSNTQPTKNAAMLPPDSPSAADVKNQVQNESFGKKIQQQQPPQQQIQKQPKVENKQQSAALPPDSPPAAAVKKQVESESFGLKSNNTTAAQPPSSPKASEVKKQVQQNLFGQKVDQPKSADNSTKPIDPNQSSGGLFAQKPQPAPGAGAGDTSKMLGNLSISEPTQKKQQTSLFGNPLTDNKQASNPTPPTTGSLFSQANNLNSKPILDQTAKTTVENKNNNTTAAASTTQPFNLGQTNTPATTATTTQQPVLGGLFSTGSQSQGGIFNIAKTNQPANTNNDKENSGAEGLGQKKKKLSLENKPEQNSNNNNGLNQQTTTPAFSLNSTTNPITTNTNNQFTLGSKDTQQPQQPLNAFTGLFGTNNNNNTNFMNNNTNANNMNTNNNTNTGAFNFGGLSTNPTINTSKPLFGNTTNQNSSSQPFGNTSGLFNTTNTNSGSGNMFGFNTQGNTAASTSTFNPNGLQAFASKPAAQPSAFGNPSFGTGNSTFGTGNSGFGNHSFNLNNNGQQNNAFKKDISNISFGFGQQQPQQQQQQQQPQVQQQQQTGNMFAQFQSQGGNNGMFGGMSSTNNMPSINQNNAFFAPRK